MNKDEPKYAADDLSLAEFVESMAVYLSWIKKHIIKFIVFAMFGAFLFGIWAWSQPEMYKARLTFVLNDQNNPQISSAGGILSQLGIPINTGRYNVDRLLGTAASQKIIENTLLSTQTVDSHEDFLGNHFINQLDLAERWAERYSTAATIFTTDSIKTEAQSYAITTIYRLITGSEGEKGMLTMDYGKTDYIMSMTMQTPNEELSLRFINQHFKEVSDFYIKIASDHNQKVYRTIEGKRDSIKVSLDQLIGELAIAKDRNAKTFRTTSNVSIVKMEAQIRALSTALESAERFVGQAGYALQTSTPLIQLLDAPREPIEPSKPSIIKYGLIGVVVGIVFFLFFMLVRDILRKVY